MIIFRKPIPYAWRHFSDRKILTHRIFYEGHQEMKTRDPQGSIPSKVKLLHKFLYFVYVTLSLIMKVFLLIALIARVSGDFLRFKIKVRRANRVLLL